MNTDIVTHYRTALLKYAYELLGPKYHQYQDTIMRLTAIIVTEKDYKDFGQLLVDLWQTGYSKAVAEYKEAVEKAGLKVQVIERPPPAAKM